MLFIIVLVALICLTFGLLLLFQRKCILELIDILSTCLTDSSYDVQEALETLKRKI